MNTTVDVLPEPQLQSTLDLLLLGFREQLSVYNENLAILVASCNKLESGLSNRINEKEVMGYGEVPTDICGELRLCLTELQTYNSYLANIREHLFQVI